MFYFSRMWYSFLMALADEWGKILVPLMISILANLLILVYVQKKISKDINRANSAFEKGRESIESYLSSLLKIIKVSELYLEGYLGNDSENQLSPDQIMNIMVERINWSVRTEIYCSKEIYEKVNEAEVKLMDFFRVRTEEALEEVKDLEEEIKSLVQSEYGR